MLFRAAWIPACYIRSPVSWYSTASYIKYQTPFTGLLDRPRICDKINAAVNVLYLFLLCPVRMQHIVNSLSVCVGIVCVSVCEHISRTTWPIFANCLVRVPRGPGSILFWRRCDTLCTSVLWITSRLAAVGCNCCVAYFSAEAEFDALLQMCGRRSCAVLACSDDEAWLQRLTHDAVTYIMPSRRQLPPSVSH